MTGRQLEKARDRQMGRDGHKPLEDDAYDELEGLLRSITLERGSIRECMGFCLDHADAAADVMRTLKESLLTPLGPSATWKTKLARLYLVSDVLHNSSAPSRNASRYRALVQAALPEVFEALGAARLALESRLAREAFDARVSADDMADTFMPSFRAGITEGDETGVMCACTSSFSHPYI